MRGAAAVGTLAFIIAVASPVVAHEVVLVEPRWCDDPPKAASGHPTPGSFPGPAKHFRMTNIELDSFDLAKEIPGLLGRRMRARFWLMEPGGMIAEHCHSDRPAFVYMLQGEVVETIEIGGKSVVRKYKAGDSVPERNGTRHWWVNQGAENVMMVAIDIPNVNMPPPNPIATTTEKVTTQELHKLLLKKEYPHLPQVSQYKVQGRLVRIAPTGTVGLTYHGGHPGIAYVIEGLLLEHRSDMDGPIVRRKGDISLANNGLWNSWENKSPKEAILLVVEFDDCGACDE